MRNKILIIQPSIPAYRVPFFQELAKNLGGVDIFHFGTKMIFNHQDIQEYLGSYFSYKSLKYVKDIRLLIKDYDIVISVFDPHWLNLFFLPLISKKKVILWGHGFGRNNMINKIRLILAKKSHALITYNEIGKKIFVEHSVESKKIFVANNTIWVNNRENTSDRRKRSFIYVGRLQRRKKLELFFPILSDIDSNKKINFNIIGDGEHEKKYLKERAAHYNVMDQVNFIPGTTNEDELKQYFSEAYAYISPGAVGLGLIHSFAYGVPVCTIVDENHGPEISNLVHMQNGVLASNMAGFSKIITDCYNDGSFQKMGNEAYDHYVFNCNMNRMVGSFVNAINFKDELR
jgi:glycosyltransferase involved in cell wall biosynthesis